MKIALISEYYYPLLGGITEHVHNLACTLKKRGHDVAVVTHNIRHRKNHHYPDEPGNFPVDRIGRGIPIYSNGSFARVTFSKRLQGELRTYFEREKFDVIHAHSPLTPTLPFAALRQSNAPVTVGTFHTFFERSRGYSLFQNFTAAHMDRMDGKIVVSEACVEALSRYFVADYRVIPNGVDTDCFHPGVAPEPGFDDGKLNILFVGRFDPRNGLRTMLESFRLVKREFDGCRLIVVGDGPLKPYYSSLIGRELAADVHFAGLQNGGRPAYYSAADIFCTPCTKASFGVVLLEAMATGVPIVASDINGYRLVMDDARQGTLVPELTADSFAEALLDMLMNPAMRERMGREGRQTAVESYSWDLVGSRVEEFYMQLLAGAGDATAVPAQEQILALNN